MGPAVPPPDAPLAPFQLSVEEESHLDIVLRAWHQKSSEIKTFRSKFTVYEYGGVFGNGAEVPTFIRAGEIRYVQPDKGLFQISHTFDPEAKKWATAADGEHWICDGKAIYEFRHAAKELLERRLPPELQGKAISDGPLPFVFGVDPQKMKQRYWMKVVTPPDDKTHIWLEAHPKLRQDAANFQLVEIILTNDDKMLPVGLQLYDPNGKDRKAYSFIDPGANRLTDRASDFVNVFVAPQTPLGWKRIIEEPGGPQTAGATNPPAGLFPEAQGQLPSVLPPRR
jgi:TIGR03009 family protein